MSQVEKREDRLAARRKSSISSKTALIDQRHRDLIQKTFSQLDTDKHRPKLDSIFLKFFQEFPECKSKLASFRFLSDEAVVASAEVKRLGEAFLPRLSRVIQTLHQPLLFNQTLLTVIDAHSRSGISQQDLQCFFQVFHGILKEANPDLTQEETEAWKLFFNAVGTQTS